jgi:hypothetical protein
LGQPSSDICFIPLSDQNPGIEVPGSPYGPLPPDGVFAAAVRTAGVTKQEQAFPTFLLWIPTLG